MKDAKVQSLRSLREEMKAERPRRHPVGRDSGFEIDWSREHYVVVMGTGPNGAERTPSCRCSVRWANRTGVCQAASRAAIRRGDRKAGAGAIDVVVLSVGRRQRRRGAIVADV
jgi:hypothetical protein